MERKQFTFYRSYLEAINRLPNKEQGNIVLAICNYALNETVPEKLSPIAETVFTLVKPTLDASRRKAEVGYCGGKTSSKSQANDKQSVSKTEANRKQTASEKEGEIEKEIEKEIENECYISPKPPRAFDAFWKAYPKKSGKGAAEKAFSKLPAPASLLPKMLEAIELQKQSIQWQKENGQFIPNPSTWINQRRWEDELPQASRGGFAYDAGGFEEGTSL